jgi:hypothetical protein
MHRRVVPADKELRKIGMRVTGAICFSKNTIEKEKF